MTTADTPRTMTPTQINKLIAIACGWKPVTHPGLEGFWEDPKELGFAIASIPNYHGDLNAMHEAESFFLVGASSMVKETWLLHLRRLSTLGATSAECATAAQRAEAFLRTLGKWEDGK